jgi:hypothetical protein
MEVVWFEKALSTESGDPFTSAVRSRIEIAMRSIKMRVYPLITRLPIADILLVAVAVGFSAVSIAFPFGRDQGLYYYVGREWLHGSIPYRDTVDQKTPLIYLIYALAIVLFGENLWGIRLFELIWVVVIGQCLGSLAAEKSQLPIAGTRGVTTIALAVLYWGFLSYWETAQCEIWGGGFCFASLWLGQRVARRPLAWWLAGSCAGLALLTKPTTAVMLVVVLAFFIFQLSLERAKDPARWREIRQLVAHFSLAATAPIAITIGYFLAVNAVGDFFDILVGANTYYLLYERTRFGWPHYLMGALIRSWPFSIFVVWLPLIGLGLAWRARSLDAGVRYALAVFFLLSAVATVAIQGKFYVYHWTLMIFPGAYVIGCSVNDLARWISSKSTRYGVNRIPAIACACVIVALYFDYASSSPRYRREIVATFQYLTGSIDQDAFDRQFELFKRPRYSWRQNRQIGRWLAEHSKPDDLVAVRGFEPAIYAISGRRAPTRFFWTSWLTVHTRAYNRDKWLLEERQALKRRPPRYFVVVREMKYGTASAIYAARLGYVKERFRTPRFSVMERP